VHSAYVSAFAASLRPVFLVAAAIGAVAFALTWLLREVPLRQTASAEGLGESFASPRRDDSLRELERVLTVLARSEERWGIYERLAERAGLELAPPELKRAPRGYPIDHPRIERLRMKEITVYRRHPLEPWLHTPKARARIRTELEGARPLVAWLAKHVGPSQRER
jgi:hypothetical protein